MCALVTRSRSDMAHQSQSWAVLNTAHRTMSAHHQFVASYWCHVLHEAGLVKAPVPMIHTRVLLCSRGDVNMSSVPTLNQLSTKGLVKHPSLGIHVLALGDNTYKEEAHGSISLYTINTTYKKYTAVSNSQIEYIVISTFQLD